MVIISGRLIYQNQILKFDNSRILMRWLGLVFVGIQGVGLFWFKLNTYQSYTVLQMLLLTMILMPSSKNTEIHKIDINEKNETYSRPVLAEK